MFSISTMASSTSTPATNDKASMLIELRVKSIAYMNAKVGIAAKGMASAEIAVERQSRRNTSTTSTASTEPSIIAVSAER